MTENARERERKREEVSGGMKNINGLTSLYSFPLLNKYELTTAGVSVQCALRVVLGEFSIPVHDKCMRIYCIYLPYNNGLLW